MKIVNNLTTTYQAKVLKGDLTPAFMIDLAKKDLGIALNFSEHLNVPLTLALESDAVYPDAQTDGRSAQDWTAIYQMLREKICPGIIDR